jgi:hypothetical protein
MSISFDTPIHRTTIEQKKKLLKAKIAVALHDELGRVHKQEKIENVFLMARVMYKAVLGLNFQQSLVRKRNVALHCSRRFGYGTQLATKYGRRLRYPFNVLFQEGPIIHGQYMNSI